MMTVSFDLCPDIRTLLTLCNAQPADVHLTAKERRQMKSVNVEEALKQKVVKRTGIKQSKFILRML
jgi:DNA-binding protein